MELGYNINHGRNVLRHLYYMPSDMFISCEYICMYTKVMYIHSTISISYVTAVRYVSAINHEARGAQHLRASDLLLGNIL